MSASRRRKNKRKSANADGDVPNGDAGDGQPQQTVSAVASSQKATTKKKVSKARLLIHVLLACAVFFALKKVDDAPIPDIITSSPLWGSLNSTLQEFAAQLPAFNLSSVMTQQPGQKPIGEAMAALGHKAHHPVVLMPGFVTSGLELWEGRACSKKYFRQRMWGTMAMAQHFLLNKQCWLDHMSLDPVTGMDPPGIRIRSAVGLEAVDFFVQGYWVWSKLIEALAQVGYDHTNLVSLPYDWRLGQPLLEVRDGFYSRIKSTLEGLFHAPRGAKVVVVGHSFGETVFRNFLAWVEMREPGWTEAHLEAFVNVAGPTLGVPKALTSLLSGETRDTADLGSLSAFLTDNVIPMQVRAQLFRSWGSVAGLLPVGGCPVWGNSTWAPDDDSNITAANRTFGTMVAALELSSKVVLLNSTGAELRVRGPDASVAAPLPGPLASDPASVAAAAGAAAGPAPVTGVNASAALKAADMRPEGVGAAINESAATLRATIMSWLQLGARDGLDTFEERTFNVEEAIEMVSRLVGPHYAANVQAWSAAMAYQDSGAAPPTEGGQLAGVVDPLTYPLPAAPSMRLYCFYGVGIPTERAYHYINATAAASTKSSAPEAAEDAPVGDAPPTLEQPRGSGAAAEAWRINDQASDDRTNLDNGIQLTDGDGTVPLLSLGLMCRKAWKSPTLNPAGIPVITREYANNATPTLLDPRGGGGASDHVSVLGNEAMLVDVIKIATGHGATLQDSVVSDIDRIAARVPLWPDAATAAPTSAQAASV